MKRAIKYLVTLVYKPLLSKYLAVPRMYSYKGIRIRVPPEVFHPGFFFSTRILLGHIGEQPLEHKSLLELGAGSGLISLYSARRGAIVTASDINPVAVANLKENELRNKVKMAIIHSDLFRDIPLQTFDIIAINPPYYKKNPQSPIDHAWYCGEHGEYFQHLFNSIGAYLHNQSQVLMILSENCDLEMIQTYAGRYGWEMECILTRKNLIEKLFLYKIGPVKKHQHPQK